jgi:glutathione S-transferase
MSGRFPVAVPGGFFKRPIAKGRDKSVIGFPKSLEPMRLTLRAQPYLGGEMPNYADDIVFGGFQWARAVSPFKLLEADDPVYAWHERLLDAFDGLARQSPGYPV